jgi:hypothetical protein
MKIQIIWELLLVFFSHFKWIAWGNRCEILWLGDFLVPFWISLFNW